MNIVNFWQQQIDKWNTDLKCGFCWDFSAPLTESAINIVQPTDGKECCVKVMLVMDRVEPFSTNNTYDDLTGLLTRVVCQNSFQVLFLMYSDLGTNNFNEIKGHDTEESKWSSILFKLQECIACDLNLDFCEILGSAPRVTRWGSAQVINYMDSNYSGYRLTVNLQRIV